MALEPANSSDLEQLALKGLNSLPVMFQVSLHLATVDVNSKHDVAIGV